MESEVELVDVPSDPESVDNLCDSDSETENDVCLSQRAKGALNIPSFLPHSLVETIIKETNLYAQQKNAQQEPVTKKEFLTYLGINALMGIKKLPSYRDYWSSNPQLHDAYISPLMSVNRFGFFLSHLDLNNNNNEPKKGDPNYDKLYKLRPMIDTLNETFKTCYNPGKY
ncbi:piggyBac transposable element-derived protein 2-like [Leptopilina boulardi]|uniref:piggyBac transposable element-derived protein 2-like n=1 Tax=Leptopilina boulardi TaxID=63433 RepID=UPI0021F67FF0|nr:piggyBac transposable element-derived protein 2-like [Leptopilina boulardi]